MKLKRKIVVAIALLGFSTVFFTPLETARAQDAEEIDARIASLESQLTAVKRTKATAIRRSGSTGALTDEIDALRFHRRSVDPDLAADDETGQRLAELNRRVDRLIALARQRQAAAVSGPDPAHRKQLAGLEAQVGELEAILTGVRPGTTLPGRKPGGTIGALSVTEYSGDIDGEAAYDGAGKSVAMSANGDTVIVGAPGNDGNDGNLLYSGHARVFGWDGSAWVQKGADIAGEAAYDLAGTSVAMSANGDTVIVGAAGDARVFAWDGSARAWNQKGADIDGEGWSVAMSANGDTVIVGAPFNDVNDGRVSDSGRARVFAWDGSARAWDQKGADIDGEAYDRAGWSVAMSANSDTVIVGAGHHARVFAWDGSARAWDQKGADIDGDAAFDEGGTSVAMSANGDTIIIGVPYNHGNGYNSGHARVFAWDGSARAWDQKGANIDGEADFNWAGTSVAMSANGATVIVGAPYNDGNGSLGSESGHARVFAWDGSALAWVQKGADIDGEAADDEAGTSVAMSANGATVIVGAPTNDGNGSLGYKSGHARVFALKAVPVWLPK